MARSPPGGGGGLRRRRRRSTGHVTGGFPVETGSGSGMVVHPDRLLRLVLVVPRGRHRPHSADVLEALHRGVGTEAVGVDHATAAVRKPMGERGYRRPHVGD